MPALIHVTTIPESLGFFTGHVRYLQARDFRVSAVSSPGAFADHLRSVERIPVYAAPMARSMRPASDVAALCRLWRLFVRLKPDIVHSHTPKAGLLGTLAARLAGVRVVFLSVFGLPQMTRSGPTRLLLNATTRVACAAADRVWCDSPSIGDHLHLAGLCPKNKIVVFAHGSVDGVDALQAFSPDRFRPARRAEVRARHGIPQEAPVLGYVGRIVRDKGMHEMVAAWNALRMQYDNLHLLVVGAFEAGDPLSADDERTLRTDTRIHLTGHQTDVAAHYAAMDVFLMPSYREGFGISNIEASAMELPVVSTRIPGCVDSVQDGVTGTLVPPGDAEALHRAVDEYVRDHDLRRLHGQAGRTRVLRDFRPEEIRESLRQEYLRLLARTKDG